MYREVDVTGCIATYDKPLPKGAPVTVRVTSDKYGKTLSLTCSGIMIAIPLENAEEIMEVELK